MKLKKLAGALAVSLAAISAPAFAQDKGTVGIAMPTKSSARWIDDGNNMVKQLEEAGYATDPNYGAKIRRIMNNDSMATLSMGTGRAEE